MKQALKDANLTINNIDDIVMVGGSSRIPAIQEIVKQFFNQKQLSMKINADEAVAIGATIQGAVIKVEDNIEELIIKDINPISIGTNVTNNLMSFLIPKGTQIPCKISNTYWTVKDDQTAMRFDIYQGERKNCDENHYLGGFEIDGLRKAPQGKVKFEVVAELDENSILKVSAKEIGGTKYRDIEIKGVNKLTKDEIAWFSKQEILFNEDDKIFSKKVKAKEGLINYIYKQKKEVENMGESKKNKQIIAKLENILNWIKGNDTASIGMYKNKLNEIKMFIEN